MVFYRYYRISLRPFRKACSVAVRFSFLVIQIDAVGTLGISRYHGYVMSFRRVFLYFTHERIVCGVGDIFLIVWCLL